MRVAIYYRKGKQKDGTCGITPLLFNYTAKFTKFMQQVLWLNTVF